MAKEMRSLVASADVTPLIDRGAEVDTEIKTLTTEDKAIKKKLGSVTEDSIQEGETSIRLNGTKSNAVVSAVEKLEVNANAEGFNNVRLELAAGHLQGILEKEQCLAVPQADVERAAECLKQAGIGVMITESFTIVADEFKKILLSGVSSEQGKAVKVLDGCVDRSVTYRVKYEERKQ